ncbi:Gap-Pol poly [Brachionus plicatilis]|uniref:Gap-Pol poly n=1 Tax=Brachionus plicatilis TaxID=10195 RepID=A0A3M7QTU8_BRAPC|nr:Gap-Pol poly [Brachionus plicatilis]
MVNNVFYQKCSTSIILEVEGQTEEILIDSGAQTSFISEKYAQLGKFKRTKIKKRKYWITANGSQLEVSGQTSMNIMIGNTRIIGTFIISRKLAHDLIIGVDFLKPNNCICPPYLCQLTNPAKNKRTEIRKNYIYLKCDYDRAIFKASLHNKIRNK